jgi:hypothetical protein
MSYKPDVYWKYMKNVNDIYTKKNKNYTKSNKQDKYHFKPSIYDI